MTMLQNLTQIDTRTLSETARARLLALTAKPMTMPEYQQAWSRHDEIVDHSQRDGVEVHQLSDLLRYLYATFPVVISDTRETLDGAKYTHLTGLALTQTGSAYVWCGVCLTQFKPDGIFETCISTENNFPSLIALISE